MNPDKALSDEAWEMLNVASDKLGWDSGKRSKVRDWIISCANADGKYPATLHHAMEGILLGRNGPHEMLDFYQDAYRLRFTRVNDELIRMYEASEQ